MVPRLPRPTLKVGKPDYTTEVSQSLIAGGFHIFNMGKPSPDWRVILRGLEFGGGGEN